MENLVADTLAAARDNVAWLAGDAPANRAIADGAALLSTALGNRRKVYAAGNGGSLCDAMHFAEELSGSFRQKRDALAATAIADPAHLTCVANDFGFEHVFSRYVEAHVNPGDVFVGISTSGSSPNVLAAADAARACGGSVLVLTGRRDSPLGDRADVEICTPVGTFSDRVQELHIIVVHLLVELVERTLFPSNYVA